MTHCLPWHSQHLLARADWNGCSHWLQHLTRKQLALRMQDIHNMCAKRW